MSVVDLPPVLPPAQQEMVLCAVQMAQRYHLPANVLLAVAEQEGGRPGQWVRNDNGTYDVGALQFNTAYLADLRRFGITPADVADRGCYPYELAAWRIKKHVVEDKGSFWKRVANYHSRNSAPNQRYQSLIKPRAQKWWRWLTANYATHDLTETEVARN
ncbi:hypothetical protein FBY14_1249 [Azospirillum brasilense]|nr:hypothetical protein FBY14_1249 [Azospirillum brasilense]